MDDLISKIEGYGLQHWVWENRTATHPVSDVCKNCYLQNDMRWTRKEERALKSGKKVECPHLKDADKPGGFCTSDAISVRCPFELEHTMAKALKGDDE